MAHQSVIDGFLFNVEYDSDSMHLPAGDFPSVFLPHIPVFSGWAVEALAAVLQGNDELLPLNTGDDEYMAFNVTSVVLALSRESEIVYYLSGRVMDVKRYVLDDKCCS